MLIHIGYQETIYHNQESPILEFIKSIVSFDKSPYKTIQYTKIFGCGTLILFLVILVAFWNKN